MKTLIIILISLFVMIGIPLLIHFNFPAGQSSQHYYLTDYKSSGQLFSVLGDVITKNISNIFLWCCDCILYYAKVLHITYEELNIYLFVIWQPYLILLFMVAYINEKIKTIRLYKMK